MRDRNTGPCYLTELGAEVYVGPSGNILALITTEGSVFGEGILPSAVDMLDDNLVYLRAQMALEFAQGTPLNRFSSDRRDSAALT